VMLVLFYFYSLNEAWKPTSNTCCNTLDRVVGVLQTFVWPDNFMGLTLKV